MTSEFDFIFISYDEENAEENWDHLKRHLPNAKRVHNVRGIREAHEEASKVSETDFFFTVDGDNRLITPLNITPPKSLDRNAVYVWRCLNPINGLIYGYGGVKLWHKSSFQAKHLSFTDHAMSATKNYRVVFQLASKTLFNTSAFSSWKSGFREVAKLTRSLLKNYDEYTFNRINSWLSIGSHMHYGIDAINGARHGVHFATITTHDESFSRVINDFDSIRTYYNSCLDISEKTIIQSLIDHGLISRIYNSEKSHFHYLNNTEKYKDIIKLN